jgi:hypothetical protein
MTLSIIAEHCYAECRLCTLLPMLNVTNKTLMLNVIMLTVTNKTLMLNVIMLSVTNKTLMLNVNILIVIMLSVVKPE